VSEFDVRVRHTLAEAQRLGFIGPGSLEPQVTRSRDFAVAFGAPAPAQLVDLGTGGGLPGLLLAGMWPTTSLRLLDANRRRCDFLRRAVRGLGLDDRVVVDERRAEEVGRDPAVRAVADLVVARSFGPPAVTAECAAPLLGPDGLLIVSEPPEQPARWPVEPLAELGLAVDPVQEPGFVRLRQAEPCPSRYPRRVGVPAKRPLF
jgi:16S rRNA (guanine527-N7)-methyltransferase